MARVVAGRASTEFEPPGVQIDPEFADTYGLRIENNHIHDCYRPAVFMGSQNGGVDKRKMRDVEVFNNRVRRITGSHGLWLRKGAAQGKDNNIAEVGPNRELTHWEDAK